jgi:hypothetical protein
MADTTRSRQAKRARDDDDNEGDLPLARRARPDEDVKTNSTSEYLGTSNKVVAKICNFVQENSIQRFSDTEEEPDDEEAQRVHLLHCVRSKLKSPEDRVLLELLAMTDREWRHNSAAFTACSTIHNENRQSSETALKKLLPEIKGFEEERDKIRASIAQMELTKQMVTDFHREKVGEKNIALQKQNKSISCKYPAKLLCNLLLNLNSPTHHSLQC